MTTQRDSSAPEHLSSGPPTNKSTHTHRRAMPDCCSFPPERHDVISRNKILELNTITSFYQRVSIASYASAGIARGMSVCPSVTLRYCIKTKKASVMISSPSESPNILVSGNVRLIPKFDRGHPERGRFMRLGWVRTGDFSTNKPPYLRNGAI